MNSLIIFLFCLFNCIICDELECAPLITDPSPNTFYLFQEDEHNDHQELNNHFMAMLDPRLNIQRIFYNEPKCIIKEMIQHAENGISVINIYAKDYHNYNLNRLANALAYTEYSSKNYIASEETVEVCQLNQAKVNAKGYEICTPVTKRSTVNIIKLISNIIEKENNAVFKAVLDFEGDFMPLQGIFCNSSMEYNQDFDDGLKLNSSCELREDTFVAMAPSSKDIVPTDTPIIFYEESYLSPETNSFKNAIVGEVNTENMKNALLFFLQQMEWKRIAIVTDDSAVNIKFEEQLAPYLRENGIFLTSDICMTKDCDFKILKTLDKHEVKVIIANVDEENSKKLVHASVILHKKKWIVRDWSDKTTYDVSIPLGDIFVMSSLPIYKHTVVKNALKTLMDSHKYCKYCKYTNSDVAQHLRKVLPSRNTFNFTKIMFTIHEFVGSISFDKKGTITNREFKYPYKVRMNDGPGACAIKTGRVYKQCDDKNLLLLLMIIAVFFITVLGIVYFFQSPIVSYQRFS